MQNQLIDLYRNGIKTAADMTRVSLENSVRMQEKQLEIVRGILDEQSRSADEITRASSMEDLFKLQSRFATAQLGRMMDFWTSVWQASTQHATRSAEDVARAAASQVSRAVGSLPESADAANQDRKARRTA